ncbi:MAG: CRTAC1 family protein [Phycisphaerae bacterium]
MVIILILLLHTPALAGEQKVDAPVRFTDVTAAAGIDFVETIGDHEMSSIVESAGVGCAFLDYDGDGWLDIYLISGCWLEGISDNKLEREERDELARATDRLYRNRGNGTFEDVTAKAGLAVPAYGMGVVAADYDGDADVDVYITNYGRNRLYRNNGDGTFTDVASASGVADPGFGVGAVFFDYDVDGRLDLYVGNYVSYDPNYKLYYAPDGFPGPLAYTGQQDRLYHGNADGTFTDVTGSGGIEISPIGRAMGVAALDYDNDGLLDVFVSNDAMENFLLHNKGSGTFENVALETGVAFGENGEATAAMGVEIGDVDGDGVFDMFVPDMTFSCLYRNMGKGTFEDEAAKSGIAQASGQYVGWGSVFADFDLDGKLDLYVSNGDAHHLEPQKDMLLMGDGAGRFRDVSDLIGGWLDEEYVGRGVAGGDFDNDGDVDLLVTNLNDRPALLRNDTPRRGRHWLSVALTGRTPNRDAIGAVVTVRVGKTTLVRQRLSGGSYLSQHDARLHFGLGDHRKVDKLEVVWPDRSRLTLKDVAADQLINVRQQPTRTGEGR